VLFRRGFPAFLAYDEGMPAAETTPESVDPRIRRTRLLLQDALVQLLKKKGFDEISVQDIAEEATINRATFYAHYADKYALLECVTASRFYALLDERGAKFNGDCAAAFRSIVLAVCDYLASFQDAACAKHQKDQRQAQPHMELAMIAVLRSLFLDGLRRHPPGNGVSAEMVATTASWAIFGAAKEWASSPNRVPAEQIVDVVVNLVLPVFQSA
jgi:AcrR family transcriptional regulator